MTLLDGPSPEQRALSETVHGVLAKRSDSAAVRKAVETERGYDESLWQVLCDQIGVAALAIPEQYGGAGASLAETHVVAEELGRMLTPSPLLGSAVLAAHTVLGLDDHEACARLLPGIASGRSIAALCWAGADGCWRPQAASVRATFEDGTWRLDGEAAYVLDGDYADVVLAVAETRDGIRVFEAEPRQCVRTHTLTMDLTRRLARVTFTQTPARRLGEDARAALAHARDVACIALSAEQVGAAARILELTVEYAKLRVQFGRPIGSFQALKHRLADLHVLVESARSASYAAVDGTVSPAVAKAHCSEALFAVAAEAIQLHGGIAITWEHDAHLVFKRSHALTQLAGQPHVLRAAAI